MTKMGARDKHCRCYPQVDLHGFDIVKTMVTGDLPDYFDLVWPPFERRLPLEPAGNSNGLESAGAASHTRRTWVEWRKILNGQLAFIHHLAVEHGLEYPGMCACTYTD